MNPDQPDPEEPPVNDADPAPTGHPRVDAAVAELDRIAPLPPADQVDGYARVHQELQTALAALDEER